MSEPTRRSQLTRVVLVEDDRPYRDALRSILQRHSDLDVVGTFSTADAMLEEARRHQGVEPCPWELVLMDIDMPGTTGVEATRRLTEMLPVQVLMLTVFEEPVTIVNAICAGASGYILKRSSANEIVRQIETFRSGGAALSGDVARRVLEVVRTQEQGRRSPRHGDLERLTDRERDVLRGLVDGLTYAQIAESLTISIDTVRAHIRAVYRKLHVNTATAAVARAIREGLI